MLKWSRDPADNKRMTQSVPPPGYTGPVKQPNYLLRGLLAAGALIAIFAVWTLVMVAGSSDSCLINGYGAKVCGDDAVAYCDMLARDNTFSQPGSTEAAAVCDAIRS